MTDTKFTFQQLPVSELPETLEIMYRSQEEDRDTQFNFIARDDEHNTWIVHGYSPGVNRCHIAVWRNHRGIWQPLHQMLGSTAASDMFVELCSEFAHEALSAGAVDAELVFELRR